MQSTASEGQAWDLLYINIATLTEGLRREAVWQGTGRYPPLLQWPFFWNARQTVGPRVFDLEFLGNVTVSHIILTYRSG